MDPTTLIHISELADFEFCPKSVYLHHIYARFDQSLYHGKAQTEGKIAHETIDKRTYSTKKRWLQWLSVHSRKYGLMGKIDLYDQEKKILIERKTLVRKIYDGYRYQVFAQYFALREMGHPIESIKIHSLRDNKTYDIRIPTGLVRLKFESHLERIRSFRFGDFFDQNPKKCARCIYSELCDTALLQKR